MLDCRIRRVVSCLLFSGVLLLRASWAEDAVPAPITLDNKDVAAYVVLPDVKTLINTIDGIAKQLVPPEQYKPVADQLNGMLADPDVAALISKPILGVLFKIPAGFDPNGAAPPPFAAYVPVNADSKVLDKVKEGLKDDPKAQAAYEDGLLIVATAGAMEQAKAAKALYAKVADAKIQSGLRVYVSIASLVDTFGPMMATHLDEARDQALAEIKRSPPPPDAVAMGINQDNASQTVRVFFKAVKGFLAQAEGFQLDIHVKPDAIQVDDIFAAKPGTLLADFFSGTVPEPSPELQSFLAKGFIMEQAATDVKALAAAWKKALAEITADPLTAPLAQNELVQLISQSLDAGAGQVVVSLVGGANGPEVTEAFVLGDPEKFSGVMEKVMSWFADGGVISKIYAQMGMKFEMKFAKAARSHAGVAVDRMSVNFDDPRMPKEAAEKMKAFMPQPEFAFVKNIGVMSTNPSALDMMIDKTAKGDFSPSGVTLKSVTTFGKGKNVYFDYDIVGYMKYVMTKFAPDPNAGAIFNGFKGNDPFLFSYAQTQGRMMVQVSVPLGPIFDGMKAYQMLVGGAGLAPPKQPETNKSTF
ncbi:MAG TPA: hypothetical protein VKX17_26020 [Planctomycetota bacterium]|nr:hypothetical protein [Planctomycetota bacterium]